MVGAFSVLAPMHSWDQMKPRTVYEKAVQDFTETARRLARLNQQKPMVERVLLKVYQTVVLAQQR